MVGLVTLSKMKGAKCVDRKPTEKERHLLRRRADARRDGQRKAEMDFNRSQGRGQQ